MGETVFGIVSDTHLPRFGRTLPPALIRGLHKTGVDAIVHCGDLVEALALERNAHRRDARSPRTRPLDRRSCLECVRGPTDKRFNPMYSYGIVRVGEQRIRAMHRFYLNRTR